MSGVLAERDYKNLAQITPDKWKRFVEIVNDLSNPIPTTITNAINLDAIAGATNGKTSKIIIDETQWWPLPAIAFTNRKSFSIQNLSGSDILLNFNNLAPSTEGITLSSGNERFYDIKATLYGRRKSGTGDVTLIIEELS